MDIGIVLQIVETLAIVFGVIFAAFQLNQLRISRHQQAISELVRSFQTPEFAEALNIVYNLPDGLGKQEVEDLVGDRFHIVYALMTTWESLGILVHRGEIDIDMVDDFFSGPINVSWRKLQGHVMGEREMLGRETIEEWFQWLHERLAERESHEAPVPAHIAHRDWTPPRN